MTAVDVVVLMVFTLFLNGLEFWQSGHGTEP